MRFDGDRVLSDLAALRDIGRFGTGVHRPTYSEDDMRAREWVAARMREAGLAVELDGIGNVIGRSPHAGPALLAGSHSETQPEGGWLDGALGVVYALEAARAWPERAIDVACWADEEGHFGSFHGSRSFAGLIEEAELDAATNKRDGTRLRDALARAGLAGRPRATLDPARHRGFLEAHIEQGDELESSGDRLGIVTSVVGIWQYRVTAQGTQNHAGTTRMAIRRDAGQALVRLCTAIHARFPATAGPRSVWTVGRMEFEPGAASIIPGAASMLLQVRDAEAATLEALERLLRELVEAEAAGPCTVALEALSRSVPVVLDPSMQLALERAAERVAPGRHRRMPSGAGHDVQILARRVPSAMLFVPSIGGISHHVSEDTAPADIVLGAEAFCRAAGEVAGTVSGGG